MIAGDVRIRLARIQDEIRWLRDAIEAAHDFDGWLEAYQALEDSFILIENAREAVFSRGTEYSKRVRP